LKTEITSFDIGAIVYELADTIKNARVENVYQIDRKTFLFRLHKADHPPMQLIVEAGKRVHLTDYALEKPPSPPVFCMVLRKHLNGSIVEGIEQYEFERAVIFRMRARQGTMQLVVELFGEGNVILTDQRNMIVEALTFKKMRDRSILRNETFKHAPASGKNPFSITLTQLDGLRNLGQLEIVRALSRFVSIGGLYTEEVLLRASVDKRTPCQDLTKEQIVAIFAQLQNILSSLHEGKLDPAIVTDVRGEWVDVTPIRLKSYEACNAKTYDSFNKALDDYHARMSHLGWISDAEEEYGKELAKQQRMLNDQQKALEDAKKSIEQSKRIGDLIYSHLGELQLLQQQIFDAKQKGESWEQTTSRLEKEKKDGRSPAIYFNSFDRKNMILNASVDSQVLTIDINRPIQANAAQHYERMKRAERKLEGSERALCETERRIEELQKKWTEKVEQAKVERAPKKLEKAWFEKFRWFNSSDGFLVLGGRDATTNEILVKKHLEQHDIVFHADIVGAPFVVVKTKGKAPTEQVIQEAAQFAASYSRAWREMLSMIDVYWVHPDQVSKAPSSGQYLEKGSFIIRGTKNYIRNVVLQVAIGVRLEEERMRVIGGPPDAIRKQTNVLVEVVPGERTSTELAKQIRHIFSERIDREHRDAVSKVPIEEMQRFIPSGRGAIARAGK
jgi:predicted ribosome quality control (RQC) complex YloA/Tae2 family protein